MKGGFSWAYYEEKGRESPQVSFHDQGTQSSVLRAYNTARSPLGIHPAPTSPGPGERSVPAQQLGTAGCPDRGQHRPGPAQRSSAHPGAALLHVQPGGEITQSIRAVRTGTLCPPPVSTRCCQGRAAPVTRGVPAAGASPGARGVPRPAVVTVSPAEPRGQRCPRLSRPHGTRARPAPRAARAENSARRFPRLGCGSGGININPRLSPRGKGTPKGGPGRRSRAACSLLNVGLPREHREKNKISARGRGEGRTKTPSAY